MKTTQNRKIAVIGAGPAGLTAAYELTKKGHAVDVYEASDSVGGMCKTLDLWGYKVDLGPHRFFSKNKRVNELWLEIVEKDYQLIDRLTRIFYKGKFYHYPLKPFNALANLGPLETTRCILSYFMERLFPTKEDGTFESWVIRKFGRRLYEYFFKTYSEKLWGISCKDLDAEFAVQRIKNFSLSEAAINALGLNSKQKHHTLVEKFAYPITGTGLVYEKMAQRIVENGGKIILNKPVGRVLVKNNKVAGVELTTGQKKTYDIVISSMPLTQMVLKLPGIPTSVVSAAKNLKYRNTILVFLHLDRNDLFKDQWLYMHSPELLAGRITNFNNWVPGLVGTKKNGIVVLEYWCNNNDDLWKDYTTDQLIELAKTDIRKSGLLGPAKVLDGYVYKIQKSYPVYQRGFKDKVKKIQEFLDKTENLYAIGRNGAFKYNNQDHSIFMGILVAENIDANAKNNLWEVNTDFEYHESYIITDTGLVQQ